MSGYSHRSQDAGDDIVLVDRAHPVAHGDIVMIAAAAGFDGIYVDLEHNPTSLEMASMLYVVVIVGAGLRRWCGSARQDRAARVLDGGAAYQFRRRGRSDCHRMSLPAYRDRSVGGAGPALVYRQIPQDEASDFLNRETLLLAMLEMPEGNRAGGGDRRGGGDRWASYRLERPVQRDGHSGQVSRSALSGRWARGERGASAGQVPRHRSGERDVAATKSAILQW